MHCIFYLKLQLGTQKFVETDSLAIFEVPSVSSYQIEILCILLHLTFLFSSIFWSVSFPWGLSLFSLQKLCVILSNSMIVVLLISRQEFDVFSRYCAAKCFVRFIFIEEKREIDSLVILFLTAWGCSWFWWLGSFCYCSSSFGIEKTLNTLKSMAVPYQVLIILKTWWISWFIQRTCLSFHFSGRSIIGLCHLLSLRTEMVYLNEDGSAVAVDLPLRVSCLRWTRPFPWVLSFSRPKNWFIE